MNGFNWLKECVKSIRKYTQDYELIILDNGSESYSDIRYIEDNADKYVMLNKNLGFSKANNIGALLAEGEYIVFLNNDTIVTSGWLDEMIKTINKSGSIGIVGPLGNSQTAQINNTIYFFNQYANQYDVDTEVKTLSGYCMLMRKELFDRFKFDNDLFLYYSDTLLCEQLIKSDYKCVVCAKSLVLHEHPSQDTIRNNVDVPKSYERDYKIYLEKRK
jgi:GT2 family glycosyltransferase